MTNITDEKLGCWIDGSHHRTDHFMYQVVYLANRDFDFDVDIRLIREDIEKMESGEFDDDEMLDILDSLDWTYQAAIDQMNDSLAHTPYYFEVEDQSLFLVRDYEPEETIDPDDLPW